MRQPPGADMPATLTLHADPRDLLSGSTLLVIGRKSQLLSAQVRAAPARDAARSGLEEDGRTQRAGRLRPGGRHPRRRQPVEDRRRDPPRGLLASQRAQPGMGHPWTHRIGGTEGQCRHHLCHDRERPCPPMRDRCSPRPPHLERNLRSHRAGCAGGLPWQDTPGERPRQPPSRGRRGALRRRSGRPAPRGARSDRLRGGCPEGRRAHRLRHHGLLRNRAHRRGPRRHLGRGPRGDFQTGDGRARSQPRGPWQARGLGRQGHHLRHRRALHQEQDRHAEH